MCVCLQISRTFVFNLFCILLPWTSLFLTFQFCKNAVRGKLLLSCPSLSIRHFWLCYVNEVMNFVQERATSFPTEMQQLTSIIGSDSLVVSRVKEGIEDASDVGSNLGLSDNLSLMMQGIIFIHDIQSSYSHCNPISLFYRWLNGIEFRSNVEVLTGGGNSSHEEEQ